MAEGNNNIIINTYKYAIINLIYAEIHATNNKKSVLEELKRIAYNNDYEIKITLKKNTKITERCNALLAFVVERP